jgi:hypothetical protein
MSRLGCVLAYVFQAVLLLAPIPTEAQVRAIALKGDAAPGVPAATFTSFPLTPFGTTWSTWPVCDGVGHAAFYAATSSGTTGLWSDDRGALAPLALSGGTAPWSPGSGTFQVFGQPMLCDGGPAAFLAQALAPTAKNGFWYQDGPDLLLAAGEALVAPGFPSSSTFALTDPGSFCLTRSGHLALRANNGNGNTCLWYFDPPPAVNAYFCAATGPLVPAGNFTQFNPISFNDQLVYGLLLTYWNGSAGVNWMGEGGCGVLGPVLANGDLAPPVGTIPPTANIGGIGGAGVQPDLNGANAVVFRSLLVNGGVTSANDDVVWLHDATGFHVVLREGDSAPELSPGETLAPWSSAQFPDLLADDGSAMVPARILPSGTYAMLDYHADRTLHLLARDNASAPGYPGRTLGIDLSGSAGGTRMAMNRYGQVLVQCFTRDSLDPANSNAYRDVLYMTNAAGALTPVYRSGDTVTVRPGLTGKLTFSPLGTAPLPSSGSDGRIRNFTDLGEYILRGQFTPNGSGTALDGVFGVTGTDVTPLAVDSGAPAQTGLAFVTPNPTSREATLTFDIAHGGPVRLEIFDLAGRRVRTLRLGELPAGHYADRWAGDSDAGQPVAGGIYFARLVAAGACVTRRVVFVK